MVLNKLQLRLFEEEKKKRQALKKPSQINHWVNSGRNQLTSGRNQLTSGQHQLTSGQNQPTSGQNQPTSGQNQLTFGQNHSEKLRPIIIDGQNVAYEYGKEISGIAKFNARGIKLCVEYFKKRGHKGPHFLC